MITDINSEDRLVQKTFADQKHDVHGWESIYAFNDETFGPAGTLGHAASGDLVLLPIWHNITKKELIDYSPSLADKLARSTATHTVEEIAAEIVDVIKNAGRG